MDVRIERVQTKDALRAFVSFPWKVYKDSPLWVPPIKKDDLKLLSPDLHPFWDGASRELFLAFRGDEIVGRVAAIVDGRYNEFAKERCGAFGFFECLEDEDAAQALLAAAYAWLKEQGMEFMRGPLNPSTNYTCGLLVDGFKEAPGLMMPWNPPRYAPYFEHFHLRKEQDLFAYLIEKDRLDLPEWISKELVRLKEKKDFTFRSATKKTLPEDARIMLSLYRQSWARNFGFCPLTPAEEDELVKDLVTYVDLDFFVLFFHKGEPAGAMVALPNFNPLLKRLDGSIGPSVLWHYLRTRKAMLEGYRIMLFGVFERYRLMGLPLLLFDFFLEQARKRKEFKWVEGSWVLEDNAAVDELIEGFCGRITKRYRLYRKDIL